MRTVIIHGRRSITTFSLTEEDLVGTVTSGGIRVCIIQAAA